MTNYLKILAEIVSNEDNIKKYNIIKSNLPSIYKKLIEIDKDIINILNKMKNKPIEYKILGKFQKIFLLNKNDLNHQIKLLKTLLDKMSTLYELENKEKDKKSSEEDKKNIKEKTISKEDKNSSKEDKESSEEDKKNIKEKTISKEDKNSSKEDKESSKEKTISSKEKKKIKSAARKKKNKKKKQQARKKNIRQNKKINEINTEKNKNKTIDKLLNEFVKKIKYIDVDVKEKKNYKFSTLEENPNFKNMELKNKIKKFIKKYNIKVDKNFDELTFAEIYEQVFGKEWKDSIFRYIKFDKANQSKRSKYKKLLKDIYYIKKYMKYKMKYYIMLKKHRKIKN